MGGFPVKFCAAWTCMHNIAE